MKKQIMMLDDIKKQMLRSEEPLNSIACKSSDAIRVKQEVSDKDIRLEYAHDTDRIIHSLAYTRYIDKTQVYSNTTDDQISKRMTHVQFVSRAARTIARALGLNEDLCESISLGHDIGHVSFGHEGEYILDEISRKELGQVFAHNVQSVRNFMYLEKKGAGLNLTIQSLDGMLCHNGEFVSSEYRPDKKDYSSFMSQYLDSYINENNIKKLRPMTMEGCVVRISDIIGYIGKDIEDAIMLGNFSRYSIPMDVVEVIGNNNIDIMNNLITDVINNSFGREYISMSPEVYAAVKELKKFNFDNIYKKSMSDEKRKYLKEVFNGLFYFYLEKLEKEDRQSDIYTVFLDLMNENYLSSNSNKRKIIDYIAGMTDGYILAMYEKNIKGRL